MTRYLIKHYNNKGRLYYPVSNSTKLNSVEQDFVDISNCLGRFDRYFYFSRNQKLLLDVERKYNLSDFSYTLAYSLFSNGFLAYTLNRKYGIPYIVIVQNTDVNMYFKKMIYLRGIGRKILRNADKVVFISQPYKEFVLDKYVGSSDNIQEKSVVIPFGIDNFWFDNLLNKKNQANNNEIKLLFVGRVNLNKNVTTVIEACKNLIQKGYKISFTVVGNIEDPKIESLLKYHKFVNYIAYADKEQLLQIYRQNDIYIMPSIRESFGLVYAEAMSQGLPVIYTHGQGFDKHFEDGFIGYSVDCFDVIEIAKKIILIKENYKKISENCTTAVNRFKWSNIVSEYNNIINDDN
jgi:glycosyltransferase involved in cell wall biosynthesis